MYSFVIFAIALLYCHDAYSHDGIEGRDLPKIRSGFTIRQLTETDHLNTLTEIVKTKLSRSIRHIVPDELILPSGFTDKQQDPLEMAGCYLRLGKNLRAYNLVTSTGSVTATAFLDAGLIYSKTARQIEEIEPRIDMLTSAAQCYYWAFANETNVVRKEHMKIVATRYFDVASFNTGLLPECKKTTWLDKIRREKAKLG